MSLPDTDWRASFPLFKCSGTQKVPNISSHVHSFRGFLPVSDETDLKIQVNFSRRRGFSASIKSRMFIMLYIFLCHTMSSMYVHFNFEIKLHNTHVTVVWFRKPYISHMLATSFLNRSKKSGLRYKIYSSKHIGYKNQPQWQKCIDFYLRS